jgi:hypothetical protein
MIGAGVAAGSMAGRDGNAARVPFDATPEIVTEAAVSVPMAEMPASAAFTEVQKTRQAAPARREPAPSAAVAMRFPAEWSKPTVAAGSADPNAAPQYTMAYAPEPERAAPAPAAPAESFQLASTDPAPLPRRVAKPAPPKNPELFNDAQLANIRHRLRLTAHQEHYWPPVEAALRAISYKQARQSDPRRPVRGGPALAIDPNSPEVQQLKSAAFPLIMSLREDQKQEVRQLAHTMGLSKVATMF